MREYNLEYVIDILTTEEDRLFEKLDTELPDNLKEDFRKYESLRTSLISFREELNQLKQ